MNPVEIAKTVRNRLEKAINKDVGIEFAILLTMIEELRMEAYNQGLRDARDIIKERLLDK